MDVENEEQTELKRKLTKRREKNVEKKVDGLRERVEGMRMSGVEEVKKMDRED